MHSELVQHIPPGVQKRQEKCPDGTKIFGYDRKPAYVQHIVADGIKSLEENAETFFDELQSDVDLLLAPLAEFRKSNTSSECNFSRFTDKEQLSELAYST